MRSIPIVNNSFVKFVLVGVINTIVGTAVMFVLYNYAECNYWVSTAMNYVAGSVVSFFLNKYFTFKSQKKGAKVIVAFAINICCCYFFAYGIARVIIHSIFYCVSTTARDNISMIAGMVLFVIVNYIGQRFMVFK